MAPASQDPDGVQGLPWGHRSPSLAQATANTYSPIVLLAHLSQWPESSLSQLMRISSSQLHSPGLYVLSPVSRVTAW